MARRLPAVLAASLVAGLLTAAPAAAGPLGALTQRAGQDACISKDGSGEGTAGACRTDAGMIAATNVVMAPDGRFVYVAGRAAGTNLADDLGVVMYARDPLTGLLSVPAGTRCWQAKGAGGCADVRGRIVGDGQGALAISADGRSAYGVDRDVYFSGGGGLLVFARDPQTGALSQLPGTAGCHSSTGLGEDGPGTCTPTRAMDSPSYVRISPDDRFVYVTDDNSLGVLTYARDPQTGALTQLPGVDGCITKTGVGDKTPGACRAAPAFVSDVYGPLTITPDGRHAYQADPNGIVLVFQRDPQSGVLVAPAGPGACMSQDGSGGTCADGRALLQPQGLAMGRDGRTLYVASSLAPARGVAALRIDPATGALSQLAGPAGCVTETGGDGDGGTTCGTGQALDVSVGPTISPDGRTLQVFTGNGLVLFDVDVASGALTQLPGLDGCVTWTGNGSGPGTCTNGLAVQGPGELAFSPEGGDAYLAASINTKSGLALFSREAAPFCRAVSATTPFGVPVALTLSCADPNGEPVLSRQIETAPTGALGPIGGDGRVTFTPAAGFSGVDSFTFSATSASGTGAPATATVGVGAQPALPPAGPAGAAPDTVKPVARLRSARITRRGVTIVVGLSEGGTVSATLSGRVGNARRAATLATGKGRRATTGTVTISLTPAARTRRALLGLRGRPLARFRGTLRLVATDAAGNRATTTVGAVRLKR